MKKIINFIKTTSDKAYQFIRRKAITPLWRWFK